MSPLNSRTSKRHGTKVQNFLVEPLVEAKHANFNEFKASQRHGNKETNQSKAWDKCGMIGRQHAGKHQNEAPTAMMRSIDGGSTLHEKKICSNIRNDEPHLLPHSLLPESLVAPRRLSGSDEENDSPNNDSPMAIDDGTHVQQASDPVSFKSAFIEPFRVIMLLAVALPVYVNLYEYFFVNTEKGGPIYTPMIYFVGLPLTCLGLAFFTVGLQEGLMPLGNFIGEKLVETSPKSIPAVGFVLGMLLTFGEPAIGALEETASLSLQFPVIASLLGEYRILTVMGIGAGVGLAAAVGSWRLAIPNVEQKLPMHRMVRAPTILAVLLTVLCPAAARGLAWDAGAVTTGPITVPVVLSIGPGLAQSGSSSFGIVTLASLFPVFGVVFAAWIAASLTNNHGGATTAAVAGESHIPPPLLDVFWEEVHLSVQSFVPLIFGLGAVSLYVGGYENCAFANWGVALGLVKVFCGLLSFFIGLRLGLLPLGAAGGSRMVAGMIDHRIIIDQSTAANSFGGTSTTNTLARTASSLMGEDDPVTDPNVDTAVNFKISGLVGVALFAVFMIGLAQLIEPSLNVLGREAEVMSKKRIQKRVLVPTVAAGVAAGAVVGFFKLLLGFDILYVLVPCYTLALLLSYGQDDLLVGIAWDAAGVTTGSITVPLILSLGLGVASEVMKSSDDDSGMGPLGILGCASVFPIIFVLAVNRSSRTTSAREVISSV